MNYSTITACALTLAAAFTVAAGEPAPSRAGSPRTMTIVNATALLTDGSKINGEFKTANVTGSTSFADNLRLNAADVMSVAFTGQGNNAKIVMSNGDLLHFNVDDNAFQMATAVGPLEIPVQKICQLALSKVVRPVPEGDREGLVFHCTFDDEAAIAEPATGPAGAYLSGSFTEGKFGNALQTTVYAHNATFDLPPNFLNTSGCIEFWAKILNSSSFIGNGGDPRLFTITQKDTKNTICTLDLVSNNGGGNSGFSTWTILGNMASFRGCRPLRYQELFPGNDYRDWHHYAIIWDKDGVASLSGNPKTALLVDGKLVPDIQRQARNTEDAISVISSPTLLSFTNDPALNPEHTTKSPFLIDEFKIWNFAKTDFDF